MIPHLKAIWQFRYFWGSLVKLDLLSRYRRSVLGIGWSLLYPLSMTTVICIAFGSLMGAEDWKNYAPYVLAGLAIWDFMKGSLIQCCDAFYRAEAYIRQCPVPLTVYVIRAVLGQFIHFVIAFLLCVVGLSLIRQSVDPLLMVPSLVPAIVLLVIFTGCLGMIAAFANAYFHDTKHLIEVVSGLLFFLTPIIFTPKQVVEKIGHLMIDLNPVAHFLFMIQQPLIYGHPVPMQYYTTAIAMCVVAFGLACATVAWLQKRLIFQL
jgi:lipopolysaccharide transport system permease protein